MPEPRILTGSFLEHGPVTLFALWQKDDGKTNVAAGNEEVESYDLRVYDLDDDASPGAEVWAVVAADPVGVFLEVQPANSAAPAGYNFRRLISYNEADDTARLWDPIGGHKYRFAARINSAQTDLNRSGVIWDLDSESESDLTS